MIINSAVHTTISDIALGDFRHRLMYKTCEHEASSPLSLKARQS